MSLSDAYEGTLIFNWTSPIQNCISISYQISSDFGSCPKTTNTTTVNCSVGAITHEASNCTFSVRSVVCGRTGEANSPIIVTLKGIALYITSVTVLYGKYLATYPGDTEELQRATYIDELGLA